jgi:hypothetical protein
MSAPFSLYVTPGRIRPERGHRHDVGPIHPSIRHRFVENQAFRVIPPTTHGEIQRRLDTRTYPHAHVAPDVKPRGSADGTCDMCPHQWGDHDRISVRYCSATAAGGLNRSCVCATKETE